MGLFGLFATLFGLGAMAKDGIEDYFISESSKEKALREGNLEYYSNGKFQKVYAPKGTLTKEIKDPVSGHIYDTNYRTGERLIDLTEYYNNKTIQKEKMKCFVEGKAFYRTPIFDTPKGMNKKALCGSEMSPVYVSDKIPGYFDRRYINLDRCNVQFYVYVKGELIPYFSDEKKKEVKAPILNSKNIDSVEAYFEDGTRATKREFAKRTNESYKQRLINNKERYDVPYIFYEARDEETYEKIYKSLNDDNKIYIMKYYGSREYYIEAKIESYESRNGICYHIVPVENAIVYKEDGTVSNYKLTDFKIY